MLDKPIRWRDHPDVLNTMLELNARRYTQNEIAAHLRKTFPEVFPRIPTRNQVKNALAYAKSRAEYLRDKPVTDIMPYFNHYSKEIEGLINIEKDTTLQQQILAKPKRKICVISDIHIPFTNEEKLQQAIDLNRTADILVVAGDVMDMYSCMRHRMKKNIPIEVELDNTVRFFEYISNIFPIVYVLPGNHDTRAMKKVQDLLPSQLLFLVDNDILPLLARPFSNIFYHDDWWLQIGDTIFAHAEISSQYEGRPPVVLSEWFGKRGWGKRLGLSEIRCVVQAHTHQVASVYREDLKMFECGCMAQVMDYVLDPKAFMRPPLNGCVSLLQENGRTNFNESREFVL